MTPFDEHHSDEEERWVTLELTTDGTLMLVVHLYPPIDAKHILVRIISAKDPTRREAQQYCEG